MAASHKNEGGDTFRLVRRFSSIKVDFEKERRRTISKYQQQGLRLSISVPTLFQDKNEIRKRLRISVERYSMPELYVKMICALFPEDMPDSYALVKHLKLVFRLNDQEHTQLMEIARDTKLPQRIVNLEIVEARNLPAKDANGLSDPFCVIFLNSRDVAQRTAVINNTINPVWRQYFTFKVNDIEKDVLNIEVMDFNQGDESFTERLRKFKETKSRGTFGIFLRELANTRSSQELIGTLRIPVSDISPETIERWFKIRNYEDKGEIYLRMALGYNKSKDAAAEEFLQIVHFLVAYEMEKDNSLHTPFQWDENYDMWSKYILRQFKWQSGLKPKDVVLAKWRAYTLVNSIFPMNANMLCLLMGALQNRILANEYDAREISKFWECTLLVVNSIFAFLGELHDALSCPVSVLHMQHMIKTLQQLNQFLCDPTNMARGHLPFTKSAIIDRVVKSIQEGADKFYLKVFSDSTQGNVSATEDPLTVALDRLLKMGQILHEDLRLGLITVQADFKGLLGVDYIAITYKIYDEEYGKIVQSIVEEYNVLLMDTTDADNSEAGEDSMDEDAPTVKAGLAVLTLYLAVKTVADQAPADFTKSCTSKNSLKCGYHEWFYHSVATWIDILRKRIMKWVKASVTICDGKDAVDGKSADTRVTKLSKIDQQDTKEIPISPSAVDTAHMFHEIHTFWTSLCWQEPRQSYAIVRKILEELYGYLVYYASQLLNSLPSHSTTPDVSAEDIYAFLVKACTAINNINYVKEQVDVLAQQLDISGIVQKMVALQSSDDSSADSNVDYEANVDELKAEMEEQVNKVTEKFIKSCVKKISPTYKQKLNEFSASLSSVPVSTSSTKPSGMGTRGILDYVNNCLAHLNENLERHNFRQTLIQFWLDTMNGLNLLVDAATDTGKSPLHFQKYGELAQELCSMFWPREMEFEIKIDDPSTFERYDDLTRRLSFLELSLEELKQKYYEARYRRQQSSQANKTQHGAITVCLCYVEDTASLVMELLNARNLKSYDSNNSSDPYAIVSLVPREVFPTAPNFTSKYHKETLFPLFEETFTFNVKEDEMKKKGYIMLTLYDYDFIGRDEFMGEAMILLDEVKRVERVEDLKSQPQLHLVVTKPEESDADIISRFEERSWDKEFIKFGRMEREKIEIKIVK